MIPAQLECGVFYTTLSLDAPFLFYAIFQVAKPETKLEKFWENLKYGAFITFSLMITKETKLYDWVS